MLADWPLRARHQKSNEREPDTQLRCHGPPRHRTSRNATRPDDCHRILPHSHRALCRATRPDDNLGTSPNGGGLCPVAVRRGFRNSGYALRERPRRTGRVAHGPQTRANSNACGRSRHLRQDHCPLRATTRAGHLATIRSIAALRRTAARVSGDPLSECHSRMLLASGSIPTNVPKRPSPTRRGQP